MSLSFEKGNKVRSHTSQTEKENILMARIRDIYDIIDAVAPFSTAQSFMAAATALATDRSSLVP